MEGYGNLVVIDHGNGLSTAYGHNSSLASSVGQSVSAGQVIAYSGSTGPLDGPARPLRGAGERRARRPARLPLSDVDARYDRLKPPSSASDEEVWRARRPRLRADPDWRPSAVRSSGSAGTTVRSTTCAAPTRGSTRSSPERAGSSTSRISAPRAGGRTSALRSRRSSGSRPAEWISDPGLWARQLHPDDRERVLAEEEDIDSYTPGPGLRVRVPAPDAIGREPVGARRGGDRRHGGRRAGLERGPHGHHRATRDRGGATRERGAVPCGDRDCERRVRQRGHRRTDRRVEPQGGGDIRLDAGGGDRAAARRDGRPRGVARSARPRVRAVLADRRRAGRQPDARGQRDAAERHRVPRRVERVDDPESRDASA